MMILLILFLLNIDLNDQACYGDQDKKRSDLRAAPCSVKYARQQEQSGGKVSHPGFFHEVIVLNKKTSLNVQRGFSNK